MSKRFEIETIEISGFVSVLRALRLPYGLDMRSTASASVEREKFGQMRYGGLFSFDEKDLNLMSTLIRRGDEHAKAIRGIIVYAQIKAPRYWWQEADTYRVGTERLSSESTMHIDAKGLSGEQLMEYKDSIEEGKLQRRVQMFSYQTLRRIYIQRHNHRLPIWQEFCDWIKSLPYAKNLILTGLEDE